MRRRAALALGRIGRPGAVAPLLEALAGDPAGAVRSTAAFSLGILEDPLPAAAAAALEAALADPSGRVREKALEALGRRGGERAGAAVRARLAELVETPGYSGRREDVEASRRRTAWDEARLGLYALARIRDDGGDPGTAAGVLTLSGAPRTGWWVAAWTAARLRDPELLPLYRAYASAPDPLIAALGVRGLGGIVRPGADLPFGEEVLAGLGHPSDTVRIEAIRALAALAGAGRPAPEAAAARLEAVLGDPSPAIRLEALVALASVRRRAAVPALVSGMLDPDPDLRAAALRALHAQDEEGFFLLLSGWSDREPAGRIAVARRLAEAPDPRIRDLLRRSLLADEDPGVRAAALSGLGELELALSRVGGGSAEIVPALVSHLGAPDAGERAAAATALGELGAGFPRIRDAYLSDEDADPRFRLAALRAVLASAPEAERVGFAREALGDAAWPVRREAHAFLRSVGEAPEEPAPAAVLDPADYDAMLRAPYTPIAWIETARGVIEVELFIADAPRTVWHFMRLARQGFWDRTPFRRVMPNSRLLAGDPTVGPRIRSEVNERFFMRGSLGMADGAKDTGGGAFFLTLLPEPQRNGRATLFGHVRQGFEVLDRIRPGDTIRRVRIWDGVTPPGEQPPAERRPDGQASRSNRPGVPLSGAPRTPSGGG